jgi:beta-lactam-binding protein with PASTA domain/predicted Ser/Thr protein kinase
VRIDPGTIVDGRYEVICHLGSGGMADVYCAADLQLGRNVALKLLHDRFQQDAEFVERFKREASSAAGLQHEHVVSVYDRGDWDGTSYIAMEYVAGRTLKQLVREHGPLAPAQAVDLTVQILRAARFAHRRGVIHRDLKPHNVIIDEEGRAKVTDFGIARAGASDMTQTGSIMGTAQYLSPEQAQGHAVSARSDLYAIGIILYELLTGAVPFDADSAVTIAVMQVNEAPVAPRHVNPELTVELEAVVLTALQKDPAARFADADEFIAALLAAGSRVRSPSAIAAAQATAAALPTALVAAGAAPPIGPSTGAYPRVATYDPEPALAPPPPMPVRRRPRWPWALLALGLAALVLVLVLVLGATERVQVPGVVGSTISVAQQRLEQAGFEVVPVRDSSDKPRNEVIGQRPTGGTTAGKGSRVTLNISEGPPIQTVPDVVGRGSRTATKALTDLGFKVRAARQFSDSVGVDRVISQSPAGESAVEKGRTITITVSKGSDKLSVPGVVGRTQDEAQSALRADGFRVSSRTRESARDEPGTVLAQDPGAGSKVPSGSLVTITVARPPARTAVPDVVGRTQETADSILSGRGFAVVVRQTAVSGSDEDGLVQKQSPADGEQAGRGSKVTITVGRYDPSLDPGAPSPPGGTPPAPPAP